MPRRPRRLPRSGARTSWRRMVVEARGGDEPRPGAACLAPPTGPTSNAKKAGQETRPTGLAPTVRNLETPGVGKSTDPAGTSAGWWKAMASSLRRATSSIPSRRMTAKVEAVKPCLRAFWAERVLRWEVRGPVDLAALARLAARGSGEAGV